MPAKVFPSFRIEEGWAGCQGTRELVLSPLPYIVAYRVGEAVVEILHINHGAQDR